MKMEQYSGFLMVVLLFICLLFASIVASCIAAHFAVVLDDEKSENR